MSFHLRVRILSYFQRNGLWPTVRRCFGELHRLSFFGRMVLFHCPLPLETVERTPWLHVERVSQSTLLNGDRERLVNAWNPSIRVRQIADQFDAGSELWLGKLGGELAGFGWTIRGRTMETHFFPLLPDDLHLFDFFVFPEFRGRGVNVALMMKILTSISSEGIRRAFIECAAWNRPQLRSLRKTPFCRYGEATKISVLKRSVVLWHR